MPHLALVGKGITFDSGGLSLKSASGMETMKTDMGGAAAVLGAVDAAAALGARIRITAFTPLTENMPSGSATKPGDVLTTRNGKTIEVLNTKAEGRLVLADGFTLAVEAGPDAIVDLATLTGAVVALGKQIGGLIGNDEAIIEEVRVAGEKAGEPLWPLPLPDDYRNHIESDIADMRNVGRTGQAGISPPPCCSPNSSVRCPGPTSTSPGRPVRTRTVATWPRVGPALASAPWSPWSARNSSPSPWPGWGRAPAS